MSTKTFNPDTNDDSLDGEDPSTDNLGEDNAEIGNLSFDENDDSYELDVKSNDPDYDHPDPYNSAVKIGDDMDSTYDEANPYAVDEYIPNETLETGVDQLGMHIADEKALDIDPLDDILSRTPEDDRSDLDEEGYPKNDRPGHP